MKMTLLFQPSQFVYLLMFMSTLACTSVIEIPPSLERRSQVAVIDHGRHASLVLTASDNTMIRYAYGDWEYFARADTGVDEASVALFWPSKAGLGRKVLLGSVTSANIKKSLIVGFEKILIFDVDAVKADALRNALDEIFFSRQNTLFINRAYDLEFVHHPDAYWVFHNSNQVMAEWLEALGCHVKGLALFSSWRVKASF